MRRILLVLLLLLVPFGAYPKDTEITFWHSLGFHVKEIVDGLALEYSESHPGVRVTPVFQGLYEELQVKMLAAAVTRDLPDVAQVQLEYMNTYIENSLIDPINSTIPPEERDDILDLFWDLVTKDGNIYGVPFCISTTVFFYNEDAFRKAGVEGEPSTWEEMVSIGKKLTTDTNGDGKPDNYAVMFWMDGFYGIAPFLWANGGDFFSSDKRRILLTSEEMVRTITMLHDLAYKHRIMPGNWTDWESGQAFLTGNLAMGPFTSAAISYGEQNLPWKLRIVPMPSVNGRRASVLGGSALVNFAQKRKQRSEVDSFIYWLVNKENTIRLHEKIGYVPVRGSALNSLSLRAFDRKNPNFKVAIDTLDFARPLPSHPEFYKINERLREMLQEVFLGAADPAEALKKAEEEINRMIGEQ
ncbi:MAG: ABC transporter substrate-binding protein [Spirochaetes bacterium]|nr:ABC transporter substrate-binding protein [Spirochaetota bacterium]